MATSNNNKKKSSTNKYQKKAVKTVKKAAKKNPKVFIIIVLVLALLIGAGLAVYFFVLKDKIGPKGDSSSETSTSEPVSSHSHEVVSGDIKIHFLELGNKYTGDSTYIKAGDVDILIDAGSRQGSAATIKAFVDQHCTDGKLEYVIATHAHQDHIAGFVGTKEAPGIFASYKIGTFIDFALTNSTTTLYSNYTTKRDAAIASGDIEHHYTAAQCVAESDGAKKEYAITDAIKMTILDQKFYHPVSDKTYFPDVKPEDEEKKQKNVDENDFSVCALFTNGDQHYLFTGDLEKEGEKSLVELNTLPEVELFKGGHHGSYTANTDTLLDVIKPKTICICCCAGSDEYTSDVANMFPAQAAVNRMAKHTDKIYVTTMVSDESPFYKSMNGTITFSSDGKTYTVTGSNNSIILKETEWFKNNRTWPTA